MLMYQLKCAECVTAKVRFSIGIKKTNLIVVRWNMGLGNALIESNLQSCWWVQNYRFVEDIFLTLCFKVVDRLRVSATSHLILFDPSPQGTTKHKPSKCTDTFILTLKPTNIKYVIQCTVEIFHKTWNIWKNRTKKACLANISPPPRMND